MSLGQDGPQQHGTGDNNDHNTSDDDDSTDDDDKYSDAPDDDDGNYDNGQGRLVKKGSTLAVAAEPESVSSSETSRNLLDLHGVKVQSSIAPDSNKTKGGLALVRAQKEIVDSVQEEQVGKSAVVKKAVVVKKPSVVVERKAVVVEKSVDQKKAIEPPRTQAFTVKKVWFEEVSKIDPSKSHAEDEDKTDAIKKAELETTPLKKLETRATVSKNVDPTMTSLKKDESEADVKTSDPKQAKTIKPKSLRMVSSKQTSPVEVVEVKKNAIAKKPSPLKADLIPVAVESEDVELANDSKAKKGYVKKAATTATATTKRVEVERKTAAPKKAKSQDAEVVKDPKAKKVLPKKSNTSELKSVKKVQVECVKKVEVVKEKKKTAEIVKGKKTTASAAPTVVSSTLEGTGNARKQNQHSPPPLAQLLQQQLQETQKRPQDDESDQLKRSTKRRRQDKFSASGFKGFGRV